MLLFVFACLAFIGRVVATQSNNPELFPLLDCACKFNSTHNYALFNYTNRGTSTITIAAGQPWNYMKNGERDQGQEDTFLPGIARGASVYYLCDSTKGKECGQVWYLHRPGSGVQMAQAPCNSVPCDSGVCGFKKAGPNAFRLVTDSSVKANDLVRPIRNSEDSESAHVTPLSDVYDEFSRDEQEEDFESFESLHIDRSSFASPEKSIVKNLRRCVASDGAIGYTGIIESQENIEPIESIRIDGVDYPIGVDTQQDGTYRIRGAFLAVYDLDGKNVYTKTFGYAPFTFEDLTATSFYVPDSQVFGTTDTFSSHPTTMNLTIVMNSRCQFSDGSRVLWHTYDELENYNSNNEFFVPNPNARRSTWILRANYDGSTYVQDRTAKLGSGATVVANPFPYNNPTVHTIATTPRSIRVFDDTIPCAKAPCPRRERRSEQLVVTGALLLPIDINGAVFLRSRLLRGRHELAPPDGNATNIL
jgi:hypothetical protein